MFKFAEKAVDLSKLEILPLPNKQIDDIGDLSRLKELKELDLSNNRLTFQRQLEGIFTLPKLEILDLTGNPVCNSKNYRLFVISNLPKLIKLDGINVSHGEKQEVFALESGPLAASATSPAPPRANSPPPPPPSPSPSPSPTAQPQTAVAPVVATPDPVVVVEDPPAPAPEHVEQQPIIFSAPTVQQTISEPTPEQKPTASPVAAVQQIPAQKPQETLPPKPKEDTVPVKSAMKKTAAKKSVAVRRHGAKMDEESIFGGAGTKKSSNSLDALFGDDGDFEEYEIDDSDILQIEDSLAASSVSKNAKRESAAAALLGDDGDDDLSFLAKPPAAVASKPKSPIFDSGDDDDFLKPVGGKKAGAAPKASTVDFSSHSFDLDAYIQDSKTTTKGGIFD